ncbi:RNA-binding protein [Ruminobacter sp. RM87]|uniref:RNA recognition motif domain-containing protein n=1 Tax=Ruminobacter sp. RM87 TaxID=1200567 RepID=UPI00068C5485|nr:RNA-binding protein [Ruminobacter sp. RM87]
MSMKKQYLKSCFLSLVITLVYVCVYTKCAFTNIFELPLTFWLTVIFVFISGIVSPLAFVLKNRIVTDKVENPRPDDRPIDLPRSFATKNHGQSIVKDKNSVRSNSENHTQHGIKQNFSFKAMPTDESEFCDIFIGNIPFSLNELEIKKLVFSTGVDIYSLKLPKDPKTKKRKNYAFVRVSASAKDNFISLLNNKEVKGRKLSVKEANSRTVSA